MSEDAQNPSAPAPEADTGAEVAPESPETLRVASVESRSQVHADDGEPISDEMASAAAVAAVVAIRQVAIAYAAQQAEAEAESETLKGDRAGFRAPRRNVRKRLPQTWDQHLGR